MNGAQKRRYVVLLAASCVLVVVLGVAAYYSLHGRTTPEQLLARSRTDFNQNNFPAAIQNADQILVSDPNDVQALIAKASALAQEGSLSFQEATYGQQAIAVAQQALDIDPQSADGWRVIGYANEIMQNYPAAHAAYGKALSIDPSDALTLSQNAHAYDLEGDFAQAEAGYQKALSRDPTLDQALMGMGRVLLRKGNAAQALRYFEAAAMSSQNARVRSEGWYSAGVIEQGLGQNAVAEQDMNSAVSEDPTYAQAWVGLAKSLFQDAIATSTTLTDAQRTQTANQSFQDLGKALSIDPNQSIASIQLGLQYATLGQIPNALTVFKGVESIIPKDITLAAPDKQAMLAVDQALITQYSTSTSSQ